MSNIIIDRSSVATATIDYVASDFTIGGRAATPLLNRGYNVTP